MRKNLKLSKLIIMSITIILLTGISSISYAADFPTVGFYVNGEENLYFDIHTFLNNQDLCMGKINEAGLENVIFIHQSGNGNTLKDILAEYSFKDLEELDFEEVYKEILTNNELITGFNVFKVIDIY